MHRQLGRLIFGEQIVIFSMWIKQPPNFSKQVGKCLRHFKHYLLKLPVQAQRDDNTAGRKQISKTFNHHVL